MDKILERDEKDIGRICSMCNVSIGEDFTCKCGDF